MSGFTATGSCRHVPASSGFLDIGSPAPADGYGSEATGGSSSAPANIGDERPRRLVSTLAFKRQLLVGSASRTGLAIAVAAALQQKDLPALRTLPGKHPEFGIDALLQEPVPGNTGQLDLIAIGAGLLSLTHPFPFETGIARSCWVGMLIRRKPSRKGHKARKTLPIQQDAEPKLRSL